MNNRTGSSWVLWVLFCRIHLGLCSCVLSLVLSFLEGRTLTKRLVWGQLFLDTLVWMRMISIDIELYVVRLFFSRSTVGSVVRGIFVRRTCSEDHRWTCLRSLQLLSGWGGNSLLFLAMFLLGFYRIECSENLLSSVEWSLTKTFQYVICWCSAGSDGRVWTNLIGWILLVREAVWIMFLWTLACQGMTSCLDYAIPLHCREILVFDCCPRIFLPSMPFLVFLGVLCGEFRVCAYSSKVWIFDQI